MANTVSLTVRLQNALSQPSLMIRCQDVAQILQEVSSKDASFILRTVVENIFGISEQNNIGTMQQSQIGGGWGLRIITLSEHRMEFEAMRAFLSPQGPLLNLIYRLLHDPYLLLPFPISLLPAKVKTEIQDGNAAAFYTNKIQNLGPGKSPVNIMLNAFEFYIFHFGHFLVTNDTQRWSFFWASVRDTLYPTVFEDYLSTFLPCDGSVPPGPPNTPVSPRGILSPVAQRTSGLQLHSNCTNLHGLSLLVSPITRPFRNLEPTSLIDSGGTQTSSPLHCHYAVPQPEVTVWTSQVIVQVLMEIWINLCVPPPRVSSGLHFVSQNQPSASQTLSHPSVSEIFVPSSDHVRAVRMLIKHFHYFANSLRPNQLSSLDPLRRNIWPMCRKSIYFFMKHLFTHWPLDSSFRLVLETWLSYIQPWRYQSYTPLERTPNRSLQDAETTRIIELKWKEYIAENLLFYSNLFSLFLKRLLRLDLASPKNAQMLFRVAKVFSQENLIAMLHEIETLLETNQMQKSFLGFVGGLSAPSTPLHYDGCHDGQPSPQTVIQLVRSHFMEVEKQNYQHTAVFGNAVPKDVHKVLMMAKSAQDTVAAELTQQCGGCLSVTKDQKGKLNWLVSVWKSLFDAPQSREDENTLEELQRCHCHLDISIKHFCHVFNITQPDAALLTFSSEYQSSSFWASKGSPEKSRFPEQILTDEGPSLTTFGRYQLLSGMRRLDLKYEGDPDLQPICSFEVAFLVRLLYSFTRFLNDKYEPELIDLFYRRDFVGSIARVVLCPPQTIFEYTKDEWESHQRRKAKDLPPRIRLRFIANKKSLAFLILLYMFLSCLGVSFMKVTIQLVVPFLITYIVCKAALQHNSQHIPINEGRQQFTEQGSYSSRVYSDS